MLEEVYEDPRSEEKFRIRIGQTAQENWDLIDDSQKEDLWFHLEKFPSPHVVISHQKVDSEEPHDEIPKTVINYAASLCHQHSKYHKLNKLTVIWTEIRQVSKASKVGSVYPKKTRTVKL